MIVLNAHNQMLDWSTILDYAINYGVQTFCSTEHAGEFLCTVC